VVFRRADPVDEIALEEMFVRCSVMSRQRRFLRPVLSAPRGYLQEILADRENHYAFMVERDGEAIGLAELHLTGPKTADLGLIIEDSFQRRGIGAATFSFLVCQARALGVRILTADVHFQNFPALKGLRRIGSVSIRREYDVLEVELDLESAGNSMAVSRLCAS
jgi:GNAT superfamily N-acetyltransferase